jgi:hypothetical protein
MSVSRQGAPLLLALAFACNTGKDGADDTDSDAPAVAVDQCSESYSVPGAFGETSTQGIQADEATFGSAQSVGSTSVGPDPSQVHLGWPGANTSNSISFVWNTDVGTLASQVKWGEGSALDHTSKGVSFSFGGKDGTDYRVHELKLCGRLKPGTTYSYQVGGEGHWSETFQFTTPAAPGTFDTFTVAIAGDSRGAYETWGNVIAKMESHDPDFYLFSGDMVDLGANQAEWLAWWNAAGSTFASKVIVPAHGNHEILSSNYFAQFSLPNNEQWFTVDFGNATVASLNDTVATAEDITVAQADFLTSKFGASSADWKIAMHHRTEYSICDGHGSAEDVRDAWAPVFDAQHVDLVFAGHNHIYERSKVIKADAEVAAGEGTTYFVSGGAGADLYTDTIPEWFNAQTATVEHYMIAEFGPTSVTITVRDLSDNVLDTVTLPR